MKFHNTRNWVYFCLSLILVITVLSEAHSQNCETFFDLTTFNQYGSPQATWEIISSTETSQKGWGLPVSFLASPMNLSNIKLSGYISVNSDDDDDFIGFVFGYSEPTSIADDNTYNFYMFDWKSDFKDKNGREGFRFAHYNGYITLGQQREYFFDDTDNPPLRQIIETNYQKNLGWIPFQEYFVEIVYNSHFISINIDSVNVLEYKGCFNGGKFGFSTISQRNATFRDFKYEEYVDFYPSEESVCQGEDITFYPYDPACTSTPPFSASLEWFFGDGTTSTKIIPTHSYSTDGNYEVMLIVDKGNNCIDSVYKSVTIKPDPVVNLGNDTLIPACSVLELDAGNPGALYEWSNGTFFQTIEIINLNKDSTIWVDVSLDGCIASDTIKISVEEIASNIFMPNAFTPNGDGLNDTFGPVGNIDDLVYYDLFVFNRWGQLVFESSLPDIQWDGTSNGEFLPMGTYVYRLDYQLSNCYFSNANQIKGIVNLIR